MSSKHLGMKMTMIMDVMKTLRSTTHDEVQALGEGDVAPASGELFASHSNSFLNTSKTSLGVKTLGRKSTQQQHQVWKVKVDL